MPADVDVVAVLAQTDLFQGFPEPALRRLAERGERRCVRAGDLLVPAGEEEARSLHVILAGRVRIERQHAMAREAAVLAVCGPGDVVGELGLFDGPRRRDALVAAEDSEALDLSKEAVAEALLGYPETGLLLLPLLSRRLTSLEDLRASASGIGGAPVAGDG